MKFECVVPGAGIKGKHRLPIGSSIAVIFISQCLPGQSIVLPKSVRRYFLKCTKTL